MDEEREVKGRGESRYLMQSVSRKQIVINNFIGGLAWACGTLVGLALLVTIAGFILQRIDFNSILGEWLGGIIKQALQQVQPPQYR
jgi:hypothetical protein